MNQALPVILQSNYSSFIFHCLFINYSRINMKKKTFANVQGARSLRV